MLKKIILASMVIGALGVLLIMNLTTPATIHPFGLLVFFVCVYAVVLGLMTSLLYLSQQVFRKISNKRQADTSLVAAYEYATIVALGPVILLALQTVGELQLIDVVFTTIFVLLGCFYVSKRRG